MLCVYAYNMSVLVTQTITIVDRTFYRLPVVKTGGASIRAAGPMHQTSSGRPGLVQAGFPAYAKENSLFLYSFCQFDLIWRYELDQMCGPCFWWIWEAKWPDTKVFLPPTPCYRGVRKMFQQCFPLILKVSNPAVNGSRPSDKILFTSKPLNILQTIWQHFHDIISMFFNIMNKQRYYVF